MQNYKRHYINKQGFDFLPLHDDCMSLPHQKHLLYYGRAILSRTQFLLFQEVKHFLNQKNYNGFYLLQKRTSLDFWADGKNPNLFFLLFCTHGNISVQFFQEEVRYPELYGTTLTAEHNISEKNFFLHVMFMGKQLFKFVIKLIMMINNEEKETILCDKFSADNKTYIQ